MFVYVRQIHMCTDSDLAHPYSPLRDGNKLTFVDFWCVYCEMNMYTSIWDRDYRSEQLTYREY